MTDTYDRLTAILIKDYKLSAEQLSPDAALESLGIDSLGTVELLWSVEDAFGIKLPSEPVPLATLGEVVTFVDRLIAEQAAGPAAGDSAPTPATVPAGSATPTPAHAPTPPHSAATGPDPTAPSASI